MTSAELADVLQLKESYIRKHWPGIVSTYQRMNIDLYKIGRGKEAKYGYRGYGMIDIAWDREDIKF